MPLFYAGGVRGISATTWKATHVWGRVAHVAGAFGHPQLVLAFVDGTSARGWPNEELFEVVGNGLSSGDIEAERERRAAH